MLADHCSKARFGSTMRHIGIFHLSAGRQLPSVRKEAVLPVPCLPLMPSQRLSSPHYGHCNPVKCYILSKKVLSLYFVCLITLCNFPPRGLHE